VADAALRVEIRERAAAAFDVLRDATSEFLRDRAKRLGAGLAYYTLFALIPSLFFSVAIAAAFVGREAAAGGLQEQLSNVFGPDAARQVESAIATMWESSDRSNFAVISLGVILYSASVLFVAWRDSVELIWDIPYETGLQRTLRTRAFAILVPIVAGLLLAATMILQGLLAFVEGILDSQLIDAALRTAGAASQVALSMAALGALYRYSARARRPGWREILPASVFVVVILAIGFWAYGVYLRFFGVSSVTGAAGSVVLGLVVVYYSAQTLLFGAEIIKVLRERQEDRRAG